MTTAIVLLGHGSPNPAWRRPFDAIAGRIAAAGEVDAVALAWLDRCTPDLPTAVRTLVDGGSTRITVVPAFLSGAGHVLRDLPALMAATRAANPTAALTLCTALGELPGVQQAMAEAALAAAGTSA